MRRLFCRGAVLLCAAIVLPSASASATTLFLSEYSSDETPASDLTALMNFSVLGDVLTLTVTNQTHTTTSGYHMNELYFNTSDDVVDLTLDSAYGSIDGDNSAWWTLHAFSQSTKSDGFGKFDWSLLDGVNGEDATIWPTEVQVFTLTITCGGGAICDASDFGLEYSQGKGTPVFGAAKFVSGPGGDSAFGGTTIIPEPAPVALLALGLGALAVRRRRAH